MKKLLCFAILILTVTTSVSAANFADVSPADWYAESVDYAFENGLMNGVTNDAFAPQAPTTRGMIVTILYRMAGSPKVEGKADFTDVPETEYYYTPVAWAVEKRIVTGYSTDIFAPNDKITREQFATIIYRYLNNIGFDVADAEDLSVYNDYSSVNSYAVSALSWAVKAELIKGITETTLAPQGYASRAQAATIFMRLDILLCESKKATEPNDVEKQEDKTETSDENDTIYETISNESTSVNPNRPQHKPDNKPESIPSIPTEDETENDSNVGSWDKLN